MRDARIPVVQCGLQTTPPFGHDFDVSPWHHIAIIYCEIKRERERKKERTNSIQQTTIIAKDDDDDGHYSSSGDADGDPMRPTLLPSTRNNHSKQRTHRARTLEHIEHYTMSYDTK